MGHRVTNHKSKCSSLHGHRYKIEVGVDDKLVTKRGASDEGMVIDFGDLKKVLVDRIDRHYDHGFVIWEKDPMAPFLRKDKKTKLVEVSFIPTAENLASLWGEAVKDALRRKGIKMQYLKVWETPTSTATYVCS